MHTKAARAFSGLRGDMVESSAEVRNGAHTGADHDIERACRGHDGHLSLVVFPASLSFSAGQISSLQIHDPRREIRHHVWHLGQTYAFLPETEHVSRLPPH
ncbi:MAG: hypothetical protein ACP5G0_08125, partial [Desulfomonilia bacterium]